jgi:hypothetical protein
LSLRVADAALALVLRETGDSKGPDNALPYVTNGHTPGAIGGANLNLLD